MYVYYNTIAFPQGWCVGCLGYCVPALYLFTAWFPISSHSMFVSCYWAILADFTPCLPIPLGMAIMW